MLAEIFSFTINTERSIEEMPAEKFPYIFPLIEQIKGVARASMASTRISYRNPQLHGVIADTR